MTSLDIKTNVVLDIIQQPMLLSSSFIDTFKLNKETKTLKFYFQIYMIYEMALGAEIRQATLLANLNSRNKKSLVEILYESCKKRWNIRAISKELHIDTMCRLIDLTTEWQLAEPKELLKNFLLRKATK